MWSDEQLAGWLEGEGSFTVTRSSRVPLGSLVVLLQVSCTDEDVVRAGAVAMAVPVYGPYQPKKVHHSPVWKAVAHGSKAIEIALRVFPYMGIRRQQQIEVMLGAWEREPVRIGTRPDGSKIIRGYRISSTS